jgi:hypothetical protein
MKGKENSMAGRRPDWMRRRVMPAAQLTQKQPHARDSERSGQENVKDEACDWRLQIGFVMAIKDRQFAREPHVAHDDGFVDDRQAPKLADQGGEFLLAQVGISIERFLDLLQRR